LLAERVHTQEGALASTLLATAIDQTDVGAYHAVVLLDGIPGAYEQAQLGFQQAAAAGRWA
jgi:hypothetical protein